MAKRRKRLPTKATPVESPQELRKKYPEKLIDVYIKLMKTKKNGWSDKDYAAYKKESIKYLGSKSEERLECGRLIVLLYKATEDLHNVKKIKQTKKKAKKQTKNGVSKDP